MKFTTRLELQSQTTRLGKHTSYAANSRSWTGFSPSMIPCFKRFIPRSHADNASLGYNSRRGLPLSIPRLSFIPLHSPLLGESLLVSFPPLNNMLKFRGSSCFIWDLIQTTQVRRQGEFESETVLNQLNQSLHKTDTATTQLMTFWKTTRVLLSTSLAYRMEP